MSNLRKVAVEVEVKEDAKMAVGDGANDGAPIPRTAAENHGSNISKPDVLKLYNPAPGFFINTTFYPELSHLDHFAASKYKFAPA